MKTFLSVLIILFSTNFIGFAGELNICATVPDLADLARQIGGTHVSIVTFTKGQEDPHSLVAKPSDIAKLSKADALLLVGLGMEIGWAPALIKRSRNINIQPGRSGYLDASTQVTPLHDQPGNLITRALGDVHPEGNPHYLLDPVNGLRIAKWLKERFSDLYPEGHEDFKHNYESFQQDWGRLAFGPMLAKKYPLDKLIRIQEIGKLNDFLAKTKEEDQLQGWFKLTSACHKSHLVADHSMWTYFSNRFNLSITRFIEPKPGIPPSTKYLQDLIRWMKVNHTPCILTSPYFSPRQVDFVSKNTNAKIVAAAHQVSARKGAETYLTMIDHNIKRICESCANAGGQ